MKEVSPWRIRRSAESQDIEPEFSSVSSEDSVHLRDYWKILVKRRWLAVSVVAVVVFIGAYFNFTATKVYTATALLSIEPHNPRVTDISEIYPAGGGRADDYYQTQLVLLRNRIVAADVITDLGLESNTAFANARIVTSSAFDRVRSSILGYLGFFTNYISTFIPPAEPKTTKAEVAAQRAKEDGPTGEGSKVEVPKIEVPAFLIRRYLSLLSVTPVTNTRLIRVGFTTPDPELSQTLANQHLVAFLRMTLRNRFQLTSDAREFLDKQSGELKRKLASSEAALHQFRQKHGVLSLERGENIVVDRLVDLNRRLTNARAHRIEAESLSRTVQDKSNRDLSELTNQGLVQQLRSKVTTLEAEKARLATIFKPDHPRIQELNQEIEDARRAVGVELGNAVRAIETNYAGARAREEALQAEADKQQQLAMHFKEVGVDYQLLREEVNINRALYESVLKRLNETHVSSNIALSNMQISETAVMPLGPSGPNIPLNLLFCLAFGAFLGVGLALVVEYFDSRVTTPEDVWHALGLSTLGAVPHLKFLKNQTNNQAQIDPPQSVPVNSGSLTPAHPMAKELIVCHRPLSVINEAYRTIRTALLLSQAEKPPQVILLTSPGPGEGKTVTTLNLGIALAQDGYSALVLDGDMRNGQCHARLGLRNNRGLSNVLTMGLLLEQVIQKTSVTGLSLLSRGVPPPNPTELLGSPKMRRVLHELRQRFNFILMDSPPAVAISDAVVLSVVSDGVLLVIDGQKTSTPLAQKAVERLDKVRAPLLGVILNGVNPNDPAYSFYRTYSSYYADELSGDAEAETPTGENGGPADHTPNGREDLPWSWSKDKESENVDSTDDNESSRGDNANGGTIAAAASSAGEGAKTDMVERPENGPSTDRIPPAATLSQESFNKLIAALSNAIGPIARLVVHEQITALGESQFAFPKSRIPELLKRIQHEITKDELMRFNTRIPEEIRNLANQ